LAGFDPGEGERPVLNRRAAFFRGMRRAPSTGAFILICSFIGYGAFVHESGLTLIQALAIALFIWALPGQVVLVSEIATGAALWSTAIGVTLTSVRLMPLVVVLMPILRGPRTGKLHQILLSHFCAITIWVESMRRLPQMPRGERAPYYWGFCSILVAANLVATIVGYEAAALLTLELAAGLLFLTPLYFVMSMLRASDTPADRLALLLGCVLGPLVYVTLPGFELVLSGLVGGTAAYLIDRWRRRRT
jgi:predicted branched-subunit amino acid permease